MLIRSMAGDFEISIERFETENGRLVMVGRMGVWDSRMYITPRELLGVFGKLFGPKVILYILSLPVLLFQKGPNRSVTEEEADNE